MNLISSPLRAANCTKDSVERWFKIMRKKSGCICKASHYLSKEMIAVLNHWREQNPGKERPGAQEVKELAAESMK